MIVATLTPKARHWLGYPVGELPETVGRWGSSNPTDEIAAARIISNKDAANRAEQVYYLMPRKKWVSHFEMADAVIEAAIYRTTTAESAAGQIYRVMLSLEKQGRLESRKVLINSKYCRQFRRK